MIGLDEPAFWAVLLLVIVVIRVLRPAPSVRKYVYLGATCLVFATPLGTPLLAALVAVATYGYAAIRIRSATWVAVVHAAVFSALFVASQYGAGLLVDLPDRLRILPLIGLPYVYLRWLHLLVEVRTERLTVPAFFDYLAYMLPFHQIIAGPIERYPAFVAAQAAPLAPLDRDTVILAFDRITTGLLKKLVICQLLQAVFGFQFATSGLPLWAEIDAYAVFIYLDFSGYMDIVIGAGILAGWRPPENFNWPYFSRNIIEFWERWHMTLGQWIRDYLFTPANMALQRGRFRSYPFLAGAMCYLLSMVFCGLWHHTNLQFFVWGLLQAAGLVACKQYGVSLRKVLGRDRFLAFKKSRVAHVAGAFVNFQFVAISFVFAFHSFGRALDIVGRLP
jgi:D-alanyl-lipoteichoic acid acyltransferase DltB (MBOAT superfamily)